MTTPPAPEELRALIKLTVAEALLQLGVDTSDPEQVLEFQRDLQHLRDWRISVNEVKSKGLMLVVGTVGAGVLGALWIGFKDLILGTHP
jgi:hypothetical protein